MENHRRTDKEYMAFISYQHNDLEFAKWLQYQLEHYRLPSSVIEDNPQIDDSPLRIFLDKTELSTGILSEEIEHALRESHYLVVLCSPSSAKSEWVDKEIRNFLKWNGRDSVIPLIIDGVPYTADPETECYTPALCELRGTGNEILGINVADFGREVSSIKAIAYMLGLKFDRLWQRYERDKELEQQRLAEERSRLLRIQSLFLAEKSMSQLAEGNLSAARFLALKALPADIEDPDRPLVAEAEDALRKSMSTQRMSFDCGCVVTGAAIGPDGDSLFIGGYDRCVVKREIPSGKILNQSEKNSRIHNLRVSPDGSRVVAATAKGVVIFDSDGNKIKLLRSIISGDCIDALFTPDMNCFIAASSNGYIVVYNLNEAQLRFKIEAHKSAIKSLSLNKDGALLASAPHTDTIKIWDTATMTLVKEFRFKSNRINTVCFSPAVNRLLVTADTGIVRLIDVESGETVWENTSSEKPVQCGAFSHDGKTVAIGGADGVLRLIDAESGATDRIHIAHADAINCIGFDSTDSLVVTGSDDETVQIIQVKEDKALPNLHSLGITGWHPAYNASANNLAAITRSGSKVIVFNSEMEKTAELSAKPGAARTICFSHSSDMLVALITGEVIKLCVWDAATMSMQRVITCDTQSSRGIGYYSDLDKYDKGFDAKAPIYNNGRVRFSSDDSIVAFAWGKVIDVYKLVSGRQVRRFADFGSMISNFAIDSAGKTLIVGMQNGLMGFRDIETGKKGPIVKFGKGILDIDVDPSGDRVAVALNSRMVAVYSRSLNKNLLSIDIGLPINTVKFINNGTQLVVAGAAIDVYDAATGDSLVRFNDFDAVFTNITPGGNPSTVYLALNTGQLYRLYSPVKKSLADLIKETNSALGSFELSPDDRARFYLDI